MNRRYFLSSLTATALGFGGGATWARRRRQGCLCGVPDMPEASLLFPDKWGQNHLRWYMGSRDSDLDKSTWDAVFTRAFASWSRVTRLTFEQVLDYSQADLAIGVSGRKRSGFGKRGGVLAWAQLPVGRNFDGRLLSMFDTAELWTDDPAATGTLLQSVAAHEIGHLLGLRHSDDKNALMYPYITDAKIPQGDDVSRIRALYGRPKAISPGPVKPGLESPVGTRC